MPKFQVIAHETIMHVFNVEAANEQDASYGAYDNYITDPDALRSSSADWYIQDVTELPEIKNTEQSQP